MFSLSNISELDKKCTNILLEPTTGPVTKIIDHYHTRVGWFSKLAITFIDNLFGKDKFLEDSANRRINYISGSETDNKYSKLSRYSLAQF